MSGDAEAPAVLPPPAGGFDLRVPLLIVGAGAGGLVAALAAAGAGAEPLLVEADASPSGSTALSAGLIPAAGTRWQDEAGIADDPATFAADIMRKAYDEPDSNLVDALTRNAAPTLEWLADAHDLPFSLVDDFDYPGHARRRMHGLPTRAGRELVDALREAVEAAGTMIAGGRRAVRLFAEAGTVRGVGLRRPDGGWETVGCDRLVLACNGFGGARALVARHMPDIARAVWFGHDGNRGEAVQWAEGLGAATRHLGAYQGHGNVAHPHGILVSWATITEGGYQVNARGERFHDEGRGYSEAARAVLAQPGGVAVTVHDARIGAIARQFEDYRRAEEAGAVRAFATLAELAEAFDLPGATLAATHAAFERAKNAAGKDEGGDAWGRDLSRARPLVAPFRAVRVTGALFHTQGGLDVSPSGRVRRADGGTLPNLWAVGGAACGVSGSGDAGYLSGNGLLSAVVLGRLAGREAAATLADGCLAGDRIAGG